MRVDDINCKDTSNEAYECFWPVLSSCHLEEAFLSRLFPGTHSVPIFCISCFLRLVCRSKSFTLIHRQIASWPLARPQLSRFSSMRKIGSWKMVEIVVINLIKSYFSALFAVCKGPNLNSNNAWYDVIGLWCYNTIFLSPSMFKTNANYDVDQSSPYCWTDDIGPIMT